MGEKNNQWRGWDLDKEISGSFPDYLSLMLSKPRIRLNNQKSSAETQSHVFISTEPSFEIVQAKQFS